MLYASLTCTFERALISKIMQYLHKFPEMTYYVNPIFQRRQCIIPLNIIVTTFYFPLYFSVGFWVTASTSESSLKTGSDIHWTRWKNLLPQVMSLIPLKRQTIDSLVLKPVSNIFWRVRGWQKKQKNLKWIFIKKKNNCIRVKLSVPRR